MTGSTAGRSGLRLVAPRGRRQPQEGAREGPFLLCCKGGCDGHGPLGPLASTEPSGLVQHLVTPRAGHAMSNGRWHATAERANLENEFRRQRRHAASGCRRCTRYRAQHGLSAGWAGRCTGHRRGPRATTRHAAWLVAGRAEPGCGQPGRMWWQRRRRQPCTRAGGAHTARAHTTFSATTTAAATRRAQRHAGLPQQHGRRPVQLGRPQ